MKRRTFVKVSAGTVLAWGVGQKTASATPASWFSLCDILPNVPCSGTGFIQSNGSEQQECLAYCDWKDGSGSIVSEVNCIGVVYYSGVQIHAGSPTWCRKLY